MKTVMKKSRSPFSTILLATDFSVSLEASLRAAFRLCQTSDATLEILHVRKSIATKNGNKSVQVEAEQLEKKRLDELHLLELRARQAGVRCTSTLETGCASERVIQAIQRKEIDLAIMGTSEPRGSKRLVFGPTAEAVMLRASCPIMTIGPVASDLVKTSASKGPVVFATDFHSVTRDAIRVAVSYCRSAGLQLHCLHVLPRALQSSDGNQALPQILTSALRHLAATCSPSVELPICCVTYGSEISNSIVDYAKKQQASLIVLGVRRSSMFTGDDSLPIVFRIITEAPCPVVTIVCDAERDDPSVGTIDANLSSRYLQ
jgi:nucleotide-binding universal stress UspA family protein